MERRSKPTRNIGIIERLAKDTPLKSFLSAISRRRSPESSTFADDYFCIPELSPTANSVVSRCARILGLSAAQIQKDFETNLPDYSMQKSLYARQFLQYCCHKVLHVLTNRHDYLSDRDFRSLTYDMMLAWEDHCTENHLSTNEKTLSNSSKVEDMSDASLFYEDITALAVQVDTKKTVGLRAFSKIASCCPLIADSIAINNTFDMLTSSSSGLLHFFIYDKYLKTLDKVLKSAKDYMGSRFALRLNLSDEEIILTVEGNTALNPVLKHEGMSAWPGRFTITTHALYFEPFRIGKNNAGLVKYDLSCDLKQVVKRELTGPLGARLFDRAVMYSSTSLKEPVYFEFTELRGHSRRDYCLEMICEILQAHIFIRQFNLEEEIERGEALSKATLSIFRYIAIREALRIIPSNLKTTLPFNLANRLPRGEVILEALYDYYFKACPSPFYLHTLGKLGFTSERNIDGCFCYFGLPKSLEKALEESFGDSEKSKAASATLDLVRTEGFKTNLIMMKELLFPVIKSGKVIYSLINWDDPWKSTVFLVFVLDLIRRGWFYYIIPISFIFFAALLMWCKLRSNGELLDALTIQAPSSKNPVEQIFIIQDCISRMDEIVKEVNITLLKLRALVFVGVPKATDMVVLALVVVAVLLILVPIKHLVLVTVVETLTREMPLRKNTTGKVRRRFKDWWARIPVVPVQITRSNRDKKNR
ncbi:hypothetical protein FCM35_KLT13479 [Carex littledalei]|uniref:Uncharacterized protein n=1 Tax=Carex littledalei TaxID=544730 RepID=A0A833QEV6_9POAL|nr:hypothetical protein FCM35_KLT13479 [Carex littledalei]